MAQRIDKQIRAVASIESKLHLLEVRREVFSAHPVPCSENTALQKREGRFNGVSVNVALHINLEFVANRFVATIFSEITRSTFVSIEVIGKQNVHVLRDILADEFLERPALCIFGMKQAEFAISLTDANDDFFVIEARRFPLSAILSAYVSFVHFYFAIEHWSVDLEHSRADAMAEVPRGFIAHPQSALNLAGRNALLCFAEKVSGREPLFEREMGVVKNRSSRNGELVVA